jgi:F0F1-type ATP synthase assembly protein I
VSHDEDLERYRERLEAKLASLRIRSTLAFAGPYQLTHELIKTSVVGDVKGFFGYVDIAEGVG